MLYRASVLARSYTQRQLKLYKKSSLIFVVWIIPEFLFMVLLALSIICPIESSTTEQPRRPPYRRAPRLSRLYSNFRLSLSSAVILIPNQYIDHCLYIDYRLKSGMSKPTALTKLVLYGFLGGYAVAPLLRSGESSYRQRL